MMLLAFLALSPKQLDSQAADLYRWFDGLGYAADLNKPFVAVQTGQGARTFAFGFLIQKASTEFQIRMPDLSIRTFGIGQSNVPLPQSKYSPIEFAGFVHKFIDIRKHRDYAVMDDPSGPAMLPFLSSESEAALSWICRKRGLTSESDELMTVAMADRGRPASLPDFGQMVKIDIAERMQAGLMMQFGYPEIKLPEIRSSIRSFLIAFPQAAHRDTCIDAVQVLSGMIAEEKTHKHLPAHPTGGETVRELVFKLRSDRGQLGWPMMDSPRMKLSQMGMEAAPYLIEALHDRSFTRSLWNPDFGPGRPHFENRVVRVGDAALQVLEMISHMIFGQAFKGANADVVQKARQWYALYKRVGEEKSLIAGTLGGGESCGSQAQYLAQVYPKDALDPIMKAYDKAKDLNERVGLVSATQSLTGSRAHDFVLKVISEETEPMVRTAAIRSMADKDPKVAIKSMIAEWNRTNKTAMDFGIQLIAQFLVGSHDPAAIDAMKSDLQQRNVVQREQVVTLMGDLHRFPWTLMFSSKQPAPKADPVADKRFDDSVEDLLGGELNDREHWNGQMGVNDLSLSNPEMSELAIYSLSRFLPDVYSFKKSDSMSVLEQERQASLNTYRSRRGLPALKVTEVEAVRPLPESELRPYIDALVAGPDPQATQALLDQGLPALSVVERASKDASGTEAKSRLTEAARSIACIIRVVKVDGANSDVESKLMPALKSYEGKTLTIDRYFGIVEAVGKGVIDRTTRPATLTFEREPDGSGFQISVRFRSGDVSGAGNISLDGALIRGMAGNQTELFMKGVDEYMSSGVRRCLASPPTALISITLDLPAARK